MIACFSDNPEIIALFLIGSVATGTERTNSDIDGVAVVSDAYYRQKKNSGLTCESIWGKCTYEGGYFDVHYKTRREILKISETGTEPMRNMFLCARTLFSKDSELSEIVGRIPVFQTAEAAEKQLRYYCTLKMSYSYFLKVCRPDGFARIHTINRIIFCTYRLILLENKILFPSIRKLEETVRNCINKPDGIIEKCLRLIQSMSDKDASDLINHYELWTSYNYPDSKDFQFIANNYYDPYEV